MYKFSPRSLLRLAGCDKRLQEICHEAIKVMDFSVLEGHRDEEAQNDAYASGRSKLRWPDSKHNKHPSLAVDLAPYPIDWEQRSRFYLLAGVMFACANKLGYKIRFGGDWDMDMEHKDQKFNDLPHFEIVE